jgi:hypothetical protein
MFMKTILHLIVCVLFAVVAVSCVSPAPATSGSRAVTTADDSAIVRAFERHASGVQVTGGGTVTRVLSDDVYKPRHQRFIVRLASGRTVLVAHNIDIAPRVEGLGEGDVVRFNGEYEWNEEGGVIHWTHRDPQGRHDAGWVEHNGKMFQ